MTTQARRHLVFLLAGLLLSAGIGWLVKHWLFAATIYVSLVAIWHIRHVIRMDNWQHSGSKKKPAKAWRLPFAAGIWHQIYQHSALQNRRHSKRQAILRRSLREFSSVTESFPEPAVILDDQHLIKWFNPAAIVVLGLQYPEDLNRPLSHILRNPQFTQWLEFSNDKPLDIESPKNDTNTLTVRLFKLGKRRQMLHFRDVTDLRNVEKMRHDFIANVSHELRTPLTVLIGYLETLMDSENSESRLIGERMHEQTRQMRTLIDDLIEISRLQTSRNQRQEDYVDVHEVLLQMQRQADSLNTKHHDIEFEIESRVGLRGVRQDLESAFRNLIVNAIRYTPDNGHIVVRYYPDQSEMVFSVKDNGIGIPKQDLPRLTERFYRVAKDRSRSSGGSGLGLSIVKHVMNAHDAKLEIISQLGSGSEFQCRFPEHKIVPESQVSEWQAAG